jgi:predicted RNA binding protein YcfA (HicA-like mRNA interferase family)
MSKLSPIHWKRFVKFVESVGCTHERTKGDHMIFWRDDLKRPVIFPKDGQIAVFVVRNNLRTLEITVEEYKEKIKNL